MFNIALLKTIPVMSLLLFPVNSNVGEILQLLDDTEYLINPPAVRGDCGLTTLPKHYQHWWVNGVTL